jgi:hypothetical protein
LKYQRAFPPNGSGLLTASLPLATLQSRGQTPSHLLGLRSQPASSNQANCSPNTVPEYEEILHRSQNQLRNGREHHTFADRARVTVDRLQLARRSNLPLAESLNDITSRAPRTRRDARGSPCGLSVDAVRRRRRVPNPRMSHTTSTMPQIRMDILDEERNTS